MVITPPRTIYVLIYPLFVFLCAGLILLSISFLWHSGGEVPQSQVTIAFLAACALAVPASVLFVAGQRITLGRDKADFRFTRYLKPNRHILCYADAAQIVFHDGFMSTDGRPRPYLEIARRDGSHFWVPLPAFGRADLRRLIAKLGEQGMKVKITGSTRFATGRWPTDH